MRACFCHCWLLWFILTVPLLYLFLSLSLCLPFFSPFSKSPSFKRTTSCCQAPATLSPTPADTRQMQTLQAGPCTKMVLGDSNRYHTASPNSWTFFFFFFCLKAFTKYRHLVAVPDISWDVAVVLILFYSILLKHTSEKKGIWSALIPASQNIWSQWNNTFRHSHWVGAAADANEHWTHPYQSYVIACLCKVIKANR